MTPCWWTSYLILVFLLQIFKLEIYIYLHARISTEVMFEHLEILFTWKTSFMSYMVLMFDAPLNIFGAGLGSIVEIPRFWCCMAMCFY